MKKHTVIGYIRASTEEQRATILAQYEAIQRHCASYGFVLPEDIVRTIRLDDGTEREIRGCFVDAGVSAEKVDFLLREDAAAMLGYMQAHGIRDIIGTKVDRVFRDVDDARFTVRALEQSGIRFQLLDVGGVAITLETAAGLFIFTMMAAVAEYENGRKVERQAAVYESHRAQREQTGTGILLGNAPYGWDIDPAPVAPGAKRKLILNPAEQIVRERLLRGDLAGETCNAAARALNKEGILSKTGKNWHGATVQSIRDYAANQS